MVRLATGWVLLAVGLMAGMVHAQFGVPWSRAPNVTVMSSGDDPRLQLVDEAVSFWNRKPQAQ